MPSVVLSSYQRASIQFEKLANVEAQRLQDLNARGQINANGDSNAVAFSNSADRISREAAELDFEITKADKTLGALDTAISAIDKMRVMVDRIKSLEDAAKSDTGLASSYREQIEELETQIAQLGESATYQGQNFFSNWGQETVTIDKTSFTTTSVDMSDIVKGFAYRGGNVLGIENGDFDTSSEPDLIAAFGADVINNEYIDLTGNFPNGTMVNGATISTSGPNGAHYIELPDDASPDAGGSYVQFPAFALPSEFTIGIWARFDTTENQQRILSMSNTGSDDIVHINRYLETDRMRFRYRDTPTTLQTTETGAGAIVDGEWAFYSVTVDAAGNTAFYKDGVQLASEATGAAPIETIRNEIYFGRSWKTTDPTLDGGLADFVMFDRALDEDESEEWYETVGLTGLENTFYKMTSDKLDATLDKLEWHFTTQQIALETTRDQLSYKRSLMDDNATNLVSIDTEEVATQTNLAQMRQTLAISSLGIMTGIQSNILNLFSS